MDTTLSEANCTDCTPATALAALTSRAVIGAADVAALRATGLAYGLTSRGDAELMIAVERSAGKKCREWGDLLVECLLDFTVWGERPTGVLTEAQATWLCEQVGEKPSPACLALLISVLEEASAVPAWFAPAVRVRASKVFSDEARKPNRKAA